MSVWNAIRTEYRFNFGHPKRLIPILAIFLIPILYAGTFLWAFWDPYGSLNHMPVAVVNLDTGATENNQSIQAGQQLVGNLKSNRDFDWKFVTKSQADSGLHNNKYFMVIEIPSNFSEQALHAMTTQSGSQPQLVCITNDKYNYIASIIGKNAAEQLKEQTAQSIAQTYATRLVTGVQELEKGLQSASSGSKQIASGANQLGSHAKALVTGANQVSSGLTTLSAGVTQSASGANQVAAGAKAVYGGTQQLNSGLGQLVTGGSTLSQGAESTLQGITQLQTGLEQSSSGASQTAKGASQLAAGLQQYAESNPSAASNPAFQALIQGSQQVAAGTEQLANSQSQLLTGATQLHQGQTEFVGGFNQLSGNLNQMKQGSQSLLNQEPSLVSGTQQLASGLTSLQSGASNLNRGIGALNNGIDQFSGGITKLQDGANKMSTSLDEATKQMPGLNTDQVVSATSNPVGLQHVQQGKIDSYGQGFAPYFLSLGLFVGALLMSIIVSFRDPADTPSSPLAWFVSKFVLVASITTVQALIADWVILKGLGLHVESASHFVLFSLLTSVTFVAIIQCLVSSMANPGRFLAVVLLILQLTSSSGTYPVILSPRFFQVLHPFLPMTYSVDGLRYLTGGGNVDFMTRDVWLLLLYTVLFMAFTLLYFVLRYRRENFGRPTEITAQPGVASQA